jgi:hypothetical protein
VWSEVARFPSCCANLHHARVFNLDGHGRFTKSSADVGIFMSIVSWRGVVADGEIWSNIRSRHLEDVTLNSRTPNFMSVSPNNLREMTPLMEGGHVWAVLAIETFVCRSFTVVHAIGDHGRDI